MTCMPSLISLRSPSPPTARGRCRRAWPGPPAPAISRSVSLTGLPFWPHSLVMHSMAARSAFASTGVGILSTAASLVALRFTGAIQPAVLDVAVPVGLVVVSVLLLRRQEWLAALLLAWAGTLWSLTSVAGLVGGLLEPVLLRLALVPHALVIGAVLSLPYGDLTGRRRVLAVTALVVALLAGAGVGVSVRSRPWCCWGSSPWRAPWLGPPAAGHLRQLRRGSRSW